MSKIFISYRRDDSADICGRIYDRLEMKFGRDQVFKDVDSIPPGVDFRKYLQEAVGQCAVALVVIGQRWLTIANDAGQRRIDDSRDYVRIEIEAALARNIPVIPVLVQRAAMPHENGLPATLTDLAFRQAVQVRSDPDFRPDMERLIHAIEKYIHEAQPFHDTDIERPTAVTSQTDMPGVEAAKAGVLARLEHIRHFFATHPHLAVVSRAEIVNMLGTNNLGEFSVAIGPGDTKERIGVTLTTTPIPLETDIAKWNINLFRDSRVVDNKILFYHNGDNSLPAPFREGSYGKYARYSIVFDIIQRFPILKPSEEGVFYRDKVYLGEISQSDPLTEQSLADLRTRLALYRIGRWTWLLKHPLREYQR